MFSKNNRQAKMVNGVRQVPHYGLRKLNVGVASVLLGTTLFLGSSTVAHADTNHSDNHPAINNSNSTVATVNDVVSTASSSTSEANGSSAVNTDQAATSSSEANSNSTISSINSNQASVVNSVENMSISLSAVTSDSSQMSDSQTASVPAVSESNTFTNSQASSASASDNSIANATVATGMPESNANVNNNALININDWQTTSDGNNLEITDYLGQSFDTVVIPNTADFINAGKLQAGQSAEISSLTMHKIAMESKNLSISKTDNAKLYAKDSDWSGVFSAGIISNSTYGDGVSEDHAEKLLAINFRLRDLGRFETHHESLDLDNMDVSKVTNMRYLFGNNDTLLKSISVKGWDTSHVTDMTGLLWGNLYLTSLTGIEDWDTSNVTNMALMFCDLVNLRQSLDLSHWNTSKVMYFTQIFMYFNSDNLNISNWDFRTANNTGSDDAFLLDYGFSGNGTNDHTPTLEDQYGQELIAGNIKGHFITRNEITTSNMLANTKQQDIRSSDNHMLYLVNDKGQVATTIISIPGIIDSNATNVADAEQDVLVWLKQKLNKYLDGTYAKMSEDEVLSLFESGNILEFLDIYNADFSRKDFKVVDNHLDSIDENYLFSDAQIQALQNPIEFNSFSDLTKWLQDFFGTDGSDVILVDQADDHDFPNKKLIAAVNGSITTTPRYEDVTKQHENDSDLDTRTQDVVSETIKIIQPDGTVTIPVDQSITFDRTATLDKKFDTIAYGPWTSKLNMFSLFNVPAINGYTPNMTDVPAQTVKAGDADLNFVIRYTPNVQKAIISYLDDTTGQVLATKDLSGNTATDSQYNTKDTIQKYLDQGYELVSDDTNSNNIIFDADDEHDQSYTVHLKHGVVDVTKDHENDSDLKTATKHVVSETINIMTPDGKTKTSKDQYVFVRHATKDVVTGQVTYSKWGETSSDTRPDELFLSYDIPVVQGYTPVQDVQYDDTVTKTDDGDTYYTPSFTVMLASNSIVINVTYTPDAQKANVTYIDDTDQKTLAVENLTGASDQTSQYNTKDTIQSYVDKGYELVSDSSNGKDIVFDHDDDQDQNFTVHLKHDTEPTSRQSTVNETIHYVYDNGKTAHDDFKATPIVFTQNGVKDTVIGIITWQSVAAQAFDEVISPVIAGYTPDMTQVDSQTVNFGDPDVTKTVTYRADPQYITINSVD